MSLGISKRRKNPTPNPSPLAGRGWGWGVRDFCKRSLMLF